MGRMLRGCRALLWTGLLVVGMSDAPADEASTPSSSGASAPLTLGVVQRQSLTKTRVMEAMVEAVNQATISAQTSGRIVEVLYDVDDYVPANAVVIRFRDTEQRARFNSAEAGLQEAQARFDEASTAYARSQDVFARKLISRSAMDTAEASFKSTRAKLDAAKAALREAKEQLEYTRVRAPYAGIVTQRHVEVGETAKPGQALITGVSLERLRVIAQVPQRWIGVVREGAQARVFLPSGDVSSQKLTFFPYADTHTSTFKVRAELPPGVEDLFPGMRVKIAFSVGQESALLVPVQAVVYRSEVSGVYVVDADGGIALRQVRLGRERLPGLLEVLAGLDEGEQVALEPQRAVVYLKESDTHASRAAKGAP